MTSRYLPRMIVVFGENGQLGEAFRAILGQQALVLGREQADFMRPDILPAVLKQYSPSLVINAAAYTAVDRAESEPQQTLAVNAHAPGALAAFCAERGIPFVHYSTDYVFDGRGRAPWREDMPTAPVNAYGESKRAGEEAVVAAGGKHLIFRTSWVFDAHRKNFLNTMLRLGGEREELRVVNDQHGAPTFAPHLAQATLRALENAAKLPEFPSGIYHLCAGGETTWHAFAEAIFTAARANGASLAVQRVLPIASAEFPTPARRPQNSRLDCARARVVLGAALPSWQQGLSDCMKEKYAHSSHAA